MHLEIEEIDTTDDETRAKYKLREAALLKKLAKVRAILAALGAQTIPTNRSPRRDLIPAMFDIVTYLEERGAPCHQFDIIRDVGDKRKLERPHGRLPYGAVWKSLEYRDRHDREFVAVEWAADGKLVKADLKDKPRLPRVKGGVIDRSEFYRSPDNFFGMKSWIGKNKSDFPLDSPTARK